MSLPAKNMISANELLCYIFAPGMIITTNLEKAGAAGLIITVLLSPCCFPVVAFAATALGLGSFEIFGGWTMWIFQAMVLLSLAGLYISYRTHRCMYPLIVAFVSTLLIVYGYYVDVSDHWIYFLYAGITGLLVATIWNYQRSRLHSCCGQTNNRESDAPELTSTITCPNCGHRKVEIMPTNACAYFYECDNCKTRLSPLKGDCCVYCSYGTVKCPPMQGSSPCCSTNG